MKKMTKGALVTGLGVALLLGGGGTLAVWNAEQSAEAGTIASGELALDAQAGVWTDANGDVIDITTYRVVPGDSLTYTQDIDVTLEGDNLEAVLSVTGGPVNGGFDEEEFSFTAPTLVNAAGESVLSGSGVLSSSVLADTETLTASTTFAFDSAATGSMNAAYDLTGINYRLDQIAPQAS